MRILVTGGTGFIGRRVAAEAAACGHTVRAGSRSAAPVTTGDGIEVVRLDLHSRADLAAALRDCDAVVHCAASLGGDAAAQQRDTVDATFGLLAAMAEAGVSRIVNVSTLAVYDYRALEPGALLDEDSPLEEDFGARGPYVAAKRRQEDAVRAAGREHDWHWTTVRPGLVFGPDRTWFHHLGVRATPTRWIGYAGASLLPLVHVDSCARAIVHALDAEAAAGAVVNLIDESIPERREYIRRLAAAAEPPAVVHDLPWSLLAGLEPIGGLAARLPGAGRLPIPGLLRPADLAARCKPLRYTSARARSRLGWTPGRDWDAALARALAGDY